MTEQYFEQIEQLQKQIETFKKEKYELSNI